MEFPRELYLQKLIGKMHNGRVKIITGIRRCGKSYLLFHLFTRYLHEQGVTDNQIIGLSLEDLPNARYRNPLELDRYVRSRIVDQSRQYYVMIDEVMQCRSLYHRQ